MRATTGKRLRCVAQTKAGKPCQAFASTPDGRCVLHGPRASEVHAAGGAATSNAARAAQALPSTLRPVQGVLLAALAKVAQKEYTPAQGGAMAALAGAIVRVFQAGEQEAVIRDMKAEIAELQRAQQHGMTGPTRWPA